MHALQHAVATDSYHLYKKYTNEIYGQSPVNLRDLLGFKPTGEKVALEDVSSITEIRNGWSRPVSLLVRSAPRRMKRFLLP